MVDRSGARDVQGEACQGEGQILTGRYGAIVSPFFNRGVQISYVNCSWKIQAPVGEVSICLFFSFFFLFYVIMISFNRANECQVTDTFLKGILECLLLCTLSPPENAPAQAFDGKTMQVIKLLHTSTNILLHHNTLGISEWYRCALSTTET